MMTYVVLATFTDHSEAGRSLPADGEDVWSDREGHYIVTVVEAPDELSATAFF